MGTAAKWLIGITTAFVLFVILVAYAVARQRQEDAKWAQTKQEWAAAAAASSAKNAQDARDRAAAASASAAASAAARHARCAGKSLKELQRMVEDECRKDWCEDEDLDDLRACAASADQPEVQKTIDREVQARHNRDDAADAELREKDREGYAATYDNALLAKHMNPDSVSATGIGHTTLTIQGWFCSRQFLYDLQKNGDAAEMRSRGFKKVTCTDSIEWQSIDL